MFDASIAFHGLAVPDVEAARAFYADTLGLPTSEEMGMLVLHLGSQNTIVYPKPDHVPATYTVLNFPVPDIDAAVDELAARGVELVRYDGFEHDAKGIVRSDGTRGPHIAWFTDPAGNVHAVMQDA
ncbi:VOC family protein [Conexibacter sp. W3-3-2]|uniref:VOC family protein n=1 Tax=Conexibacter sp. W3-3-2 TaxID=2675227 RepID=UPI0012B97FDE|nr:VOC family protein [Conexibacter sp. W3-3-2]MTD44477.1 VOC family protein [Conexibacter sp. W3-3-2]